MPIPKRSGNYSAVIFECCYVDVNVPPTSISRVSRLYVTWLIFLQSLRLIRRVSIMSNILFSDHESRYSLTILFSFSPIFSTFHSRLRKFYFNRLTFQFVHHLNFGTLFQLWSGGYSSTEEYFVTVWVVNHWFWSPIHVMGHKGYPKTL